MTLQSIGDAVISTDAEGRIEYMNPVAESLTGWSLDEARGRPIGDGAESGQRAHPRADRESAASCALGRGDGDGAPADHSVLITRSGQEVAIQESAAPICDRQGRVIGAVIVFHDVTKERRLKRALSYQASHDALTGLINRREFDNRLHGALCSGAARRGLLRAAVHRPRPVQGGERHLRTPGRRPSAARRHRAAADAGAHLRHHRAPRRR